MQGLGVKRHAARVTSNVKHAKYLLCKAPSRGGKIYTLNIHNRFGNTIKFISCKNFTMQNFI